MIETILALLGGVTLAALALFLLFRRRFGRGPLTIASSHFHQHVYNSSVGPFIRDIQREAKVPHGKAEGSDPLAEALMALVGKCPTPGSNLADARSASEDPTQSPCDKVLILSGGGQWGAFGAGLFATMAAQRANHLAMPRVRIITGISTGSLQTVLLMVALDESQTPEMRALAMERLVWGYSPARESEVVDNTGMLMMPLRGSQAGTGPLRKRIREALFKDKDPRLVEAIGKSRISGFIGFVEANCGLFHYADVRGLVTGAADVEAAVEALTAATMASSAMPVFHQQLRVAGGPEGDRSLYDGGVRRSVFFERAVEAMTASVCTEVGKSFGGRSSTENSAAVAEMTPEFFVVRNGPTVRVPAPELDRKDGPLLNGKRGYDLLVNESEIGAIAQLRLVNPHGKIFVTTADQWDTFPCQDGECRKKDEMFSPRFMACLRDLGRHKAQRAGGAFWPLSTLEGCLPG